MIVLAIPTIPPLTPCRPPRRTIVVRAVPAIMRGCFIVLDGSHYRIVVVTHLPTHIFFFPYVVEFDNPTFGKCSLNHQYCNLLQNAFHETVYIANGECDKDQAFYVQDQTFDGGKCYGGSGQSVMVECTAGACPAASSSSTTTTNTLRTGSTIADQRVLLTTTTTTLAEMIGMLEG
jgi:hypothetical protein